MSTTVIRPTKPSTDQGIRRARMDELFTAHATAVFSFALRRTSRSQAEDVVSETFLVAWRRLDDVPDNPKPWLLAVARRVLANRRRSEDRQSALRSRLGASGQETRGDASVEHSDDAAVVRALAMLPPAERDAITLIAWEGLSAEEAAVVLDCSRATFYVRFHRAKRRLAAALGTADHTPGEARDDAPREPRTDSHEQEDERA